jgi:hypothetical protein
MVVVSLDAARERKSVTKDELVDYFDKVAYEASRSAILNAASRLRLDGVPAKMVNAAVDEGLRLLDAP